MPCPACPSTDKEPSPGEGPITSMPLLHKVEPAPGPDIRKKSVHVVSPDSHCKCLPGAIRKPSTTAIISALPSPGHVTVVSPTPHSSQTIATYPMASLLPQNSFSSAFRMTHLNSYSHCLLFYRYYWACPTGPAAPHLWIKSNHFPMLSKPCDRVIHFVSTLLSISFYVLPKPLLTPHSLKKQCPQKCAPTL